MGTDRKTIGITRDNLGPLQRLVTSGQFASELDAAKFAMAHAIRGGATPGRADGADTKWNVGSVDPTGSLRSVLSAFYPEESEPYRLLEYLMNKGLTELAGNEAETPDVYGAMFDQLASI